MINGKTITELAEARKSIRTYSSKSIPSELMKELENKIAGSSNPFSIPVSFFILSKDQYDLRSPVLKGETYYIAGKVKKEPYAEEAYGYAMEELVLFLQANDLGTVWLGGTFGREAFEKAIGLEADAFMPCVTPFGYPAPKMSLRETLMRKGVKADTRLPADQLFFENDFSSPLSPEHGTEAAFEAVRLAPSAVNKQPWRVIVKDGAAHFYCKRSKGFGGGELDMQMIDMGIALCHFALAAQECGLDAEFLQADPHLAENMEYVASYRVK
jgi:hypothetical protein